ncbi:MAG: sensor histidine kinase [Oscillospiraceae bacterium]
MEQQQNWPELLELLERPAFTVEQGRVSWANQEALTRLVPQGQEIHSLLQTGAEEYAELGNGSLCLSLQIGDSRQEAAVRRLNGGVDLFLLNQEADLAGLNQLALAARQLREPAWQRHAGSRQALPRAGADGSSWPPGPDVHHKPGCFSSCESSTTWPMPVNTSPLRQPNREVTSLGSFFGEIAERASTLTAKAGVRLTYTPPTREGMGNLDRDMAERALYNLLSNALRFTPKGKTIQVTLTLTGSGLYSGSRDQGEGLHQEIQQDLFSRYRRAPSVEDGRFGLGLTAAGAADGGPSRRCLAHQRSLPEGGTIAALSFRRNLPASGAFRSPMADLDYTGCRDHGLVELSRELPRDPPYDPQAIH